MAGYIFWAQVPKFSFEVPDPKVKTYFEILWFYWIHLMIPEKMKSCLWKLEPGFWTYDWICGPNLVSRPQAPRSRQILGHFWQSYECLFPENCKKTFFGALKSRHLRNRLAKFKKWAHSEILSLRAFKWCKNQIIVKFEFDWLPYLDI